MKSRRDIKDFEAIYREHSAFLLFYLRKLKLSTEDADETIQESFLRLFNNLDKVEPEKVRGFLVRTAKNLLIDRYRKEKSQRTSCMGEGLDSHNDAIWHSDPQRDWEIEVLGHIIDDISTQPGGECFRLFYREGLSLQQIADQLNQPLGSIASRVSRFRSRFKDVIKRRLEENTAPF